MTPLREWLAAEQRVVIQGISGRVARGQLPILREAGTNVVAGVVPERRGDVGRAIGTWDLDRQRLVVEREDHFQFFLTLAVILFFIESIITNAKRSAHA